MFCNLSLTEVFSLVQCCSNTPGHKVAISLFGVEIPAFPHYLIMAIITD